MANVYQGNLIGAGKRFAIVVSRFNNFITERLLEGAKDCLLRHGTEQDDMDVFWVPGSFEISVAALRLAKSKKYHAIICLGAVIRGQTPHFDYVASEAAKGIAQVGLTTGVPAIFGVITADTLEQAIDRAGTRTRNTGSDAALSAIEMANLFEQAQVESS